MKFHLKQARVSHVSHCLQLKQWSSWCIISGYIWSFAVSTFFSSSLSIPPFNQKKSSYKIPYLRSIQKHWEEWSNSDVCFILSWFSSSEAQASLVAQMVKSACNAGDQGSIPGSGKSPEEGNGSPLQYSGLGNPMNRGAWQATVHGVAKSWIQLSEYTCHLMHRVFHKCAVFHSS